MTSTARTKPLCYLKIPRSCNRARESLRVRPMVAVLRPFFAPASARRKASSFAQSESVPTTSSLFLFIGFLPIFVIAASWYVWAKGVERGLKGSKLLDCVMIITSVFPPEPPMELSLAVNASLVALQNYAIFCTEPFRFHFAGRCFDKTGTITAGNLIEGVAGVE